MLELKKVWTYRPRLLAEKKKTDSLKLGGKSKRP